MHDSLIVVAQELDEQIHHFARGIGGQSASAVAPQFSVPANRARALRQLQQGQRRLAVIQFGKPRNGGLYDVLLPMVG